MPIRRRGKARKMVDITTSEISGVDYPATGLQGWVVMKSRDGHEVVTKRDFSDEQRQKLADTGAAMPDGGFPIQNIQDLKNAVRAIGRASNPAAAKAHIIKRARSLGATDQLPDDWDVSKSEDTATGESLTVADILAKAEELASEHANLLTAIDKATYLEDAPDDVKKALGTLTEYLDSEYESATSDPTTEALKALASEVAALKKATAQDGGATKDEPDEGHDGPDDDDDGDGGVTEDEPDEGHDGGKPDGKAGATHDEPDGNMGKSRKPTPVTKADKTTPHKFVDDGDGTCAECGEPMSGGMHKKDMSDVGKSKSPVGKSRVSKAGDGDAEDASDSGSDESSEGPQPVNPNSVHVFTPIGNAKCKTCGKTFDQGKHKKNAQQVGKALVTTLPGNGYSFSFTSSDGRVWTSTGSTSSNLFAEVSKAVGTPSAVRKEGRVPEIDRDALTDDVRAHVEQLEKALAEAESKLAKSDQGQTADADAEAEAEMLKSLPEPMRKRFEELEAVAKASAEKLEKAQREADLREAVAKAREWTHLPGLKPEEFGANLVALRKAAPDQAVVVEDLFARASAAVKESALLKEIGSGHYELTGDAASKLDAMAKESMEKASTSGQRVSYEQAYASIISTPEGRQLYDEYNRERKESGVR